MASKAKTPTAAERIEAAYQSAKRLAEMIDDVFRAVRDGRPNEVVATLMPLMESYGTDGATVIEATELIPARKDSAAIVCGENMFHALWVLCDTIRRNVVDTPNTSLAEFARGVRPKLRELELRPYHITDVWGGLAVDRRLALERAAQTTDTKTDTKKKSSKRRLPDEHSVACGKAYRREKSIDPELTLKSAVESYVADHPKVSFEGLYKRLLANRNLWE